MNGPNHVAFATEREARDWMYASVKDECIDNYRFAYDDDEGAVADYLDTQNDGCCGFFDAEVVVAGRKARIGCNYGH